jgi:hypothetical protein
MMSTRARRSGSWRSTGGQDLIGPAPFSTFRLTSRSGLWRQIRTVGASAKIENLQNHKAILENQFPYISYTFTGKLDLTDVHLPDVHPPDVHLPGVHPRRLIS